MSLFPVPIPLDFRHSFQTAESELIAEADWFTNFITFVLILAGVVVGMETYPSVVEAYETEPHILNEIILWSSSTCSSVPS